MFDWTTRLGTTLLIGPDDINTLDVLKNKKYVAFYFSAHYCEPCRKFTPLFSVLYEDQLPTDVEVIFVSQDKTEKEFTEYFETMPWYAMKWKSPESESLRTYCNVTGIPQVCLFNIETGELVLEDARPMIASTRTLKVKTLLQNMTI